MPPPFMDLHEGGLSRINQVISEAYVRNVRAGGKRRGQHRRATTQRAGVLDRLTLVRYAWVSGFCTPNLSVSRPASGHAIRPGPGGGVERCPEEWISARVSGRPWSG